MFNAVFWVFYESHFAALCNTDSESALLIVVITISFCIMILYVIIDLVLLFWGSSFRDLLLLEAANSSGALQKMRTGEKGGKGKMVLSVRMKGKKRKRKRLELTRISENTLLGVGLLLKLCCAVSLFYSHRGTSTAQSDSRTAYQEAVFEKCQM